VVEAAILLAGGDAEGAVLVCTEGLSFWGGVDPETGIIIDAHHPQHGACVTGNVLMMPTSRGSCSGSGVLLELALKGLAPAALVFSDDEEVLTLGALVSERIFARPVTVLRLQPDAYATLARSGRAGIVAGRLIGDGLDVALERADVERLALTGADRAVLDGVSGAAAKTAMEIVCLMAVAQGASALMDVTRGHIDGCILAHSANLVFAENMAQMGAKVAIPTTINAISVDRENWVSQGVAEDFGNRASRLADAYVQMGARPTFTCAPYLLEDRPRRGECVGWSESNAVIYANSVLGARTPKHPDYLDLCIAMTGRAAVSGVYTDAGRMPQRVVEVSVPDDVDDAFWPLLGWLTGKASAGRVPLLVGLEDTRPSEDDLKALCAAFGTTSGAPMLHIRGVTPEGAISPAPDADAVRLGAADFGNAWRELNAGEEAVELVAIGSPHASLSEVRALADLLKGRAILEGVDAIVTIGREVLAAARDAGIVDGLENQGVQFLPDICWCSITEPLFPANTKVLMTNSGKYAHYAFGLSGRKVRFGGLQACAEAAVTGRVSAKLPGWITS
jgi:predicted aconitase/predicted aconitase with swiveling domain